VKASDGKK